MITEVILCAVFLMLGVVLAYFILRNNPRLLKFDPDQAVDRFRIRQEEWSAEAKKRWNAFLQEYDRAKGRVEAGIQKARDKI